MAILGLPEHVNEAEQPTSLKISTIILTLFIEGNPPQEKDFKVHVGQKIIMDKYSVYVEEIRGTVKGLVTLRIKSIKGDGSN